MRTKLLNILLILTSLIGYLEWGQDNSTFLFQAEYEVIRGLITDFSSASHPFTLIPLLGQILIFITLFQKEPSKLLTYIGIACLGLLLGFMFFIGLISFNLKVLISTVPFIIVAILVIKQ